MKRHFNDIIIHCSGTRCDVHVTADSIRRFHIQDKGWEDIGYHYIIEQDGTIVIGRPLDKMGAHCYGHNRDSVGICYIGGLDRKGRPADTRTPQQKKALARLIWDLTIEALRNGWGLPSVHGHHDYNKFKDCPCFDAFKEYN